MCVECTRYSEEIALNVLLLDVLGSESGLGTELGLIGKSRILVGEVQT